MAEAKIFINGEIVGFHPEPLKFVADLRRLRRSGQISNQINVTYFDRTNEVVINTDSGRARRPVILVEDGKAKVTEEHTTKLSRGEITFDDMVKMGLVEYRMLRRRRTASSPSGIAI